MRWRLPARAALVLVVAVQALCTLFFVWDILAGVVGLPRRPLSWRMREMMEMGAGVGLVLGRGAGGGRCSSPPSGATAAWRPSSARPRAPSPSCWRSGSAAWGLTPSERDVAWFTIKGLPIADIARLRQTSEGTVKAQSNAIYRKAGVSGRAQLVSLCIEDLIDAGPLADAALAGTRRVARKSRRSRLAGAAAQAFRPRPAKGRGGGRPHGIRHVMERWRSGTSSSSRRGRCGWWSRAVDEGRRWPASGATRARSGATPSTRGC